MSNKLCSILNVYPESFTANLYTSSHFRMIGLIDARIQYSYGVEIVKLGYYRSSGTNNGKIKGLWYPIVGIKLQNGSFIEFTYYINKVLAHTTSHGTARKGWLAKSLFFYTSNHDSTEGFGPPYYHSSLLSIGETLRNLYNLGEYTKLNTLTPEFLNQSLLSTDIYKSNTHTQRKNYEHFIHDIFTANKTL